MLFKSRVLHVDIYFMWYVVPTNDYSMLRDCPTEVSGNFSIHEMGIS